MKSEKGSTKGKTIREKKIGEMAKKEENKKRAVISCPFLFFNYLVHKIIFHT